MTMGLVGRKTLLSQSTYFLLAWFVFLCVEYAVIYIWRLCVCISGLNAPESVGQYAVIFIYKDGKHNLASSVVGNLHLLFFFVSIFKCTKIYLSLHFLIQPGQRGW